MKELLEIACGTDDPFRLILRSGEVRRYHTEGFKFSQSNAEHVWRVMVIILYLWPNAERDLLTAALYHEASEALTGDLPAPLKRVPSIHKAIKELETIFNQYIGKEDTLSSLDRVRLKCADYLELCLTTATQTGRLTKQIQLNGERYVRQMAEALPVEERALVLDFLEEIRHG